MNCMYVSKHLLVVNKNAKSVFTKIFYWYFYIIPDGTGNSSALYQYIAKCVNVDSLCHKVGY